MRVRDILADWVWAGMGEAKGESLLCRGGRCDGELESGDSGGLAMLCVSSPGVEVEGKGREDEILMCDGDVAVPRRATIEHGVDAAAYGLDLGFLGEGAVFCGRIGSKGPIRVRAFVSTVEGPGLGVELEPAGHLTAGLELLGFC